MVPRSLALLATSLALGCTAAPPARADALDDALRAAVRDGRVPGLAFAVVKDGRIVRQGALGMAMVEHGVRAKPTTRFEIASLSKQFCAAAILLLVEEGKVRLEDPIGKHLPGTPASWNPITVRMLLDHTAGFPEFGMDPRKASALSFLRYTDEQQLRDAINGTLAAKPGTKFVYSNTGYALAGMIVERASGMEYNAFVRARILDPLGMRDTTFIDASEVLPNRAEGYTLRKDKLVAWRIASTLQALDMTAFGGMVSTLGDLAKWQTAMIDGKLLRPESWRAMLTSLPPARQGYGLGVHVDTMAGQRVIHHSGHTGTFMIVCPERKLGLILLSNLGIGNPPPFGNDRGWDVVGTGKRLMEGLLKAGKQP